MSPESNDRTLMGSVILCAIQAAKSAFSSGLKNGTSTGAESLRSAQPPQGSGFKTYFVTLQSPCWRVLEQDTDGGPSAFKLSIKFSQVRHKPRISPRYIREDAGLSGNGTHYQHAIPRDTQACRPLICDREHRQQQHAHASAWDCEDAHQRAKLRNVAEGWRHFQVHPCTCTCTARSKDPFGINVTAMRHIQWTLVQSWGTLRLLISG